MKKLQQFLPVTALLLSVLIAWGAGKQIPSGDPADSSSTGSVYSVEHLFENSEFKAVWVPYLSLDMQNEAQQHFGSFKEKFDRILKEICESGANTVLVHVHAFGDAMYRSSYYPWSHLLTGKQGKDPGYDALAYMVEAAHEAGLQIHAWINPLRIRSTQTPAELSADNIHSKWRNDNDPANDRWTVETDSGIYFNPAYEEVRTYIIDSVRELLANYNVDGVHMDDYFYPTEEEYFDEEAYAAYLSSEGEANEKMSLQNWRMDHINQLVSGLYQAVKEQKETLLFGISPQGNMDNCTAMCADIATWGSQSGYVDYLCPQLYYPFDSPTQPFTRTAQEWVTLVSNPAVKLYGGLALYKAGDPEADGGAWVGSGDVIRQQLEVLHENGYDGFALYSNAYLTAMRTAVEMEQILECLGAVQKKPEDVSSGEIQGSASIPMVG